MYLMVNGLQRSGPMPHTGIGTCRGLVFVPFSAPAPGSVHRPRPFAVLCRKSIAVSRRRGTSLLEATLAVALLGTMVVSTVPVVHASRRASRLTIAAVETAVLADYLASAARAREPDVGMSRNELSTKGEFGPPFHGFQWIMESTDRPGADGAVVVTVHSRDTRITLVVAR
jgi:hypothetical protein